MYDAHYVPVIAIVRKKNTSFIKRIYACFINILDDYFTKQSVVLCDMCQDIIYKQ